MSVLDTMPSGLDDRHRAVARLLLGTPEGITRYAGGDRTNMGERAFRERCEEIAASGWLPVICDHKDGPNKPGWYRLARADEAHMVDEEARQLYGRAVSNHKRSRGLVQAFQAYHSAGALFLPDIPDELEVA